jgi:hypothetical protein
MWSLKDKECTLILRDTSGDKYCSIRYDPVRELVYGGRYTRVISSFVASVRS